MTTIRTADTGRLTIAEAKRLILENSPRESFVQVYRRDDGTLQAVQDTEPKSIYASFMDEDFAATCEQLGIVPRWKYRPGKGGYTGDPATDELYTITHDETVQLAGLHGLTLEVAPAATAAEPAPAVELAPEADEAPPLEDHSTLATRAQLITAFGAFTGMSMEWFDNLTDKPALLRARKVRGVGARGKTREPLFCPWEVMLWLIDPERKKGRPFHSIGKPWELLEGRFPAAYVKHSMGDPREERTG